MPEKKEIALAVMGSAVALASVLVVFIGFLLAHAEALPSTTPDRIQRRYKQAARWGLLPTSGIVIVALAAYTWMFTQQSWLFCMWAIGLFVVMAGFLVYALVSVLMVR
jgi:predicted lysophospholipase L1 biosynthesis ABC-type transport system permease subunit